jgi:tryptophan-rich sensory protein
MRNTARMIVVLSALGSLACTLYAGQHNRSVLLVGMFAVWVSAPYAGVLGVLRMGDRIPRQSATLRTIAIVLSVSALATYTEFSPYPAGHNRAAPFLLVPICMWAVTAGMFFYARRTRTQIPR